MLQTIDAHILAASLRALASEVEANSTPAADLCNALDRLAAFLADAAKDRGLSTPRWATVNQMPPGSIGLCEDGDTVYRWAAATSGGLDAAYSSTEPRWPAATCGVPVEILAENLSSVQIDRFADWRNGYGTYPTREQVEAQIARL